MIIQKAKTFVKRLNKQRVSGNKKKSLSEVIARLEQYIPKNKRKYKTRRSGKKLHTSSSDIAMRKARKHRKWYFVAKRKFADKETGHYKIFFIASSTRIGAYAAVPAINTTHVFRGEFNGRNPVGFHHISGYNKADRKIILPHVHSRNSQGIYVARVEFLKNNAWRRKRFPSSFFPNSWSQSKVLKEIREAYKNASFPNSPRPLYWEGYSSSGLKIGGYLKIIGNDFLYINSAFPIY